MDEYFFKAEQSEKYAQETSVLSALLQYLLEQLGIPKCCSFVLSVIENKDESDDNDVPERLLTIGVNSEADALDICQEHTGIYAGICDDVIARIKKQPVNQAKEGLYPVGVPALYFKIGSSRIYAACFATYPDNTEHELQRICLASIAILRKLFSGYDTRLEITTRETIDTFLDKNPLVDFFQEALDLVEEEFREPTLDAVVDWMQH